MNVCQTLPGIHKWSMFIYSLHKVTDGRMLQNKQKTIGDGNGFVIQKRRTFEQVSRGAHTNRFLHDAAAKW